MILLKAVDLSVNFGKKKVLTGVNFSIAAGELIGLIGPNGSGKTTLLRALSGLLPTQAKKISFLGLPLSAWSRTRLARCLAYLPQNHASYWTITVEALVMLGRLPHIKLWQKPAKLDYKIVKKILQDCDLSQFSERTINTLSGGERARVFLARALAIEPKLLLADEAMAGLDLGYQLDIMQRFRKLAESGIGIIMSIHDLTLAARYCHKLVLLTEQDIVSQGAYNKVLTAKNLANSFNIRVHTGKSEGGVFVVPINKC